MTTSQMTAWLEAMPDAARLLDAEGVLIAQNLRAQVQLPPEKQTEIHRLGDGLRLETWKVINVSEPDVRSLANGLAHTLRNPLSSIMTAADLVRDDPHIGGESVMLVEIIAKESRQLNRILTDFLNYVRPRSAQPEVFDLAHALRDSVGLLRREKALPDSIEVRDDLPPKLPAWGDESAIRQSLHHVVKNAVEAMQGNGTLRLAGELFDKRGRVHIEDDGPGFSHESLARAFEPFYSYTPECAGLGLAVAQSNVHRAGGRISIENRRQEPIEYSMDDSAEKPTQGARVCIELHAPDGESELPVAADVLRQNEVVTT